MRVLVLSIGAIIVKHKDTEWLFGAPEGVDLILKENGITPKAVFTTSIKAPALSKLGPVLHFKERPLSMNGLSAKPIEKKHGVDYVIDDGESQILFSERGDVSFKDVEEYPLAIIKNRHPISKLEELESTVVSWPWADSEYEIIRKEVNILSISHKVWNSITEVPNNLKQLDDIPLTLAQVNQIAEVAVAAGDKDEEKWGIAISQFKKGHKVKDGKWVKEEPETKEKEQLSKSEVNYREADSKEKCANCNQYNDGMCYLVEGTIKSEYTCDKWQEKGVTLDKEMDNGFRIRRFGDILVANLHQAYNDTSDMYFREGFMDETERIEIASAIGDALRELRNKAPKDVMMRVIEKIPVEVEVLKEAVESDLGHTVELRSGWRTVWKDKDGRDRWASISSVAVKDNQGEIFSPEAMDWALGFSKLTGYKGPLRFRHVPGLDGGECIYQKRVGDFLFESGVFYDNPIGQRMKELLQTKDYQVSVGLLFAPSDIENGRYKRAAIFERSLTNQPANNFTAVISNKEIEMKVLTEEQLKEVASEIGLELSEVKTMYERAMVAGIFGAGQFKEMALKQLGAGVVTGDSEESDETYTREQMKEILESLSVAEFKELEELVGEVKGDYKKGSKMEDDMEEEEDMEEESMKEDDDLRGLILAQTKAMTALAAAVGKQQKDSQAVAEFLSQVPRGQAQKFVTKEAAKPSETDQDVMTQLKQIQEEMKRLPTRGGMQDIYSQFTSKTLNQG